MVSLDSCSSDDASSTITCDGTAVSFATDVSPIIKTSCATNSSCHGSGSSHGPGELLTYSNVYNARSEIKSSVANGSMPEGSKLSSNEKSSIICWIENGASDN